MTTSTLAQYQAKLAGLPPDKFVGSILWFTIAGTVDRTDGRRTTVPVRVKHDVLEHWINELGLDRAFLPSPIKRIDAFRNATGNNAVRDYNLPADGQFAHLMVREVKFDDDQVIRKIVKETRDTRGVQLHYDEVATLKFVRGGRTAKGKRESGDHWKPAVLSHLTKLDKAEVDAFIADIRTSYEDLATNLQSQAIRAMLRNYLGFLNAIPVKPSGAVYFIHHTRQATLDALQELIKRIGQGCSLFQFPLIDTEDSRDMLSDAFCKDVEDEVRLLLEEIAKVNQKHGPGGLVPATKYADLNERYQAIVNRSEEAGQLMDLRQDKAASALEMALTGVLDVAARIAPLRKGTK